MSDHEPWLEAAAKGIAAQARELFGHLPADELPDEGFKAKTDSEGRLQIKYGTRVYTLRDGAVWRLNGHGYKRRWVCFKDGEIIGRGTVTTTDIALN
jgi:hypothetical protein